MTFDEWKASLFGIMNKFYGLEENDFAEEDLLRQAFDDGETPLEYAERQGQKYDLDRIDVSAFGMLEG